MDACRGCRHFGFRLMIQNPYGYYGDIPCLRCKRYNEKQDLYEEQEFFNPKENWYDFKNNPNS